MDYNLLYFFGYLIRTVVPDLAFGFLCIAIAVFFIYKTIKVKRYNRESIENATPQSVNVLSIPSKLDLREKLVGTWRSKYDKIQYHIYPWGGSYLVEIKSTEEPYDTQYHAIFCSDDSHRFWIESDDTWSVVFNDYGDLLYNLDKNIILERISEETLKEEEEMNKIVDATLKKIKDNETA